MRRSVKEGVEEIRIATFEKMPPDDPNGVSVGEMMLGVPIHSSVFALAAMLKGFHEFYLKPLNGEEPGKLMERLEIDRTPKDNGFPFPPEMVKQYEHNLALWYKTNPSKPKLVI